MNLSNLEMLQKGTISSIEESPVDKEVGRRTAGAGLHQRAV